ncbi:hypothetical protein [Bradyrhizobium sp. Cp5.3]|uniref:hypothetical protein n=1 Tax=Bradyrhizobium sp. Cp5.3 TaxID=443598 RepID=UPI0004881A62|nr:hypothetical protein [Bradyrhizobium sp. Cp5.3]
MDFTITLSNDDWDRSKGGWRCPALQIPEIKVKNVYVDGTAVDEKLYDVNTALLLIRWSQPTHPRQAAVHLQVDKALSTEELTLRWRKLAIVLPVLGSIAAALITAVFKDASKTPSPPPAPGKKDIAKIFERSNDFLATGDKQQFPSLLKQAKREAWFVGTTFYISVDQYHDMILKKLAEGVDLNFLVLSPNGDAIGKVAHLLGVAEKELASDCLTGIRILNRTSEEAKVSHYPGTLQVKIIDEPVQTRLYFFDPKADEGYVYFIPQMNGTNSQTLPGFLVENSVADYHSSYFTGVLRMWNDPGTKSLEAWIASHPELK